MARRAAVIAVFLVAVDVVASHWETGLSPFTLTPAARQDLLLALLAVATSTTIVVPVASLALSALGAYANPAPVLLLRRYPRSTSDRLIGLVAGRTNRFHSLLLFSLAFLLSALALRASNSSGLSDVHIPALVLLALLAAANVLVLFALLYWIIRLRRPIDLVHEITLRAMDVIDYGRGLKDGGLHRRGDVAVPGVFECEYREQEELKQYCFALSELGIKALSERQPYASSEAVSALGGIRRRAAERRHVYPPEWWKMRTVGPETRPSWWIDELVAVALGDIQIAAADFHYYSVGADAGEVLVELVGSLCPRDESGMADSAVDLALKQFEYAFDDCVQFRESHLRDRIALQLQEAWKLLLGPSAEWSDILVAHAPETAEELMRLPVVNDDVRSLRQAQLVIRGVLEQVPSVGVAVFMNVCDLAADALLSRSYGAASVLIDWIAARIAEFHLTREDPELLDLSGGDPLRTDYVRVFLVLSAARSVQLDLAWSAQDLDRAATSLSRVQGELRRCELVMRRLSSTVRYPDEESRGWAEQLIALQSRTA